MGVINIVKSYPELFGKVVETIDEEDAWRIIASVQSRGSKIEKVSLEIYNQFNAVSQLFHFGLRDEAVELALEVLKDAVKHQCHEIVQQLCKLLVDESFLMDDIDSVHKYNLMYRKYTDIVELEYQAKLIYGELIYNHRRGMAINEIEIIRGLSQIEEKLPFDNLIYHYYYHSCQIILASESEYEERLLSAIRYFENLYYNHNSYLSSFVVKLVHYYQKGGQYNEVEILIKRHLKKCKIGSTVWFRYMKTACLVYLSTGEIKMAKECIEMAFASVKFQDISNKEKEEWNIFRSAWI